MKRSLKFLFLGFCCFFALPVRGAEFNAESPVVKVLLAKDVPSVLLEVKGSYRVTKKDTRSILSSGSVGKRYVVHALKEGLRWGEEYPNVFQISVVPQSEETMVYVNGIQYRGGVSIYHTPDNRVTVVNDVPIEDFLKSTLALQFKEPIATEAMAALVIAARSECYSQAKKIASCNLWDFVADEVAYFGHAVTHQANSVDEIVDATRFMIMESTKDGGIVAAPQLSKVKAEELAAKGCDAKKILASSCPHTKIGHARDHIL